MPLSDLMSFDGELVAPIFEFYNNKKNVLFNNFSS